MGGPREPGGVRSPSPLPGWAIQGAKEFAEVTALRRQTVGLYQPQACRPADSVPPGLPI